MEAENKLNSLSSLPKQSSIEWLQEQLKKVLIDNQIKQTEYLFTQAKEMHKQEVIDFANDLLAQNDINYIAVPDLAEQYYNETYNIKS